MSRDQRLCPGIGGKRCAAFMSPLYRDPHPTCARCSGSQCSDDMTCDICKDWSLKQWEAFRHKRSYSGRRKSCPSDSSSASATIPPVPSVSSEARCPSPSLQPSSSPSEGRGVAGLARGCLSRWRSWFLLSPPERGESRGSWGLRVGVSWLLPPPPLEGGGCESSRSQLSPMLASPAPPSTDPPVWAVHNPWSRSQDSGGLAEDRSRS